MLESKRGDLRFQELVASPARNNGVGVRHYKRVSLEGISGALELVSQSALFSIMRICCLQR